MDEDEFIQVRPELYLHTLSTGRSLSTSAHLAAACLSLARRTTTMHQHRTASSQKQTVQMSWRPSSRQSCPDSSSSRQISTRPARQKGRPSCPCRRQHRVSSSSGRSRSIKKP